MPKPIACLSEQLSQYLETICSCFSKRQWKYFVTILLELIEYEERNCSVLFYLTYGLPKKSRIRLLQSAGNSPAIK